MPLHLAFFLTFYKAFIQCVSALYELQLMLRDDGEDDVATDDDDDDGDAVMMMVMQ